MAQIVAAYLIEMGVSAVVAYVVANIAVAVVFAAGMRAFAPKPNKGSSAQDPGRQFLVRSSVEPRRIIYGRDKVSGVLVYASTTGTDNKYMHLVIALATHECDAVESIWFNDVQVGALDGSGNVTSGSFAGTARIKIHLGQSGQTADADLVAEDGTHWTSNHRGDGITYLYVRLEYNRNVYPTGIPNVSAVLRGKKLFDPRTSTTVWSNNWALAIRDYLTSSYGLGCDSSEIDDATFIAAANISDELVSVAAGGSDARYTCDGMVSLGDRRIDIIEHLLSAGGKMTYSQGQYKLYADAYRTPVATLTESDLAGNVKVSPRIARQNLYNAVRGTYVEPAKNYQVVDFPPVRNSSYVTEDGGEEIYKDLALPYTNGSARAQRIAKLWQVRSRQSITFTATWKPKAFKISALDNVYVSIASLGWTNKVFTVTDWRMQSDGSILMSFQEEDSTSYLWTVGNEVVIPAAAATTLPNPFSVAAPTGLSLSSGTSEQVVTTGGQIVSRIKATWGAPADIYVKSGGTIEVQAKRSADSEWSAYPSVRGDETVAYVTPVKDGETYDVRIRAVNTIGVRSAFVTVTGHSVVGKTGYANYDNLVPNGNSEMGADGIGLDPEGVGLVNDPTNAYEGSWCRRLSISGTTPKMQASTFISCVPGDAFYAEAQVKASAAVDATSTAFLRIAFYDATYSNPITVDGTALVASTAYGLRTVTARVPAGRVFARLIIVFSQAAGNPDTGKYMYVDAMYMRRVIDPSVLTKELQSSINSSFYCGFDEISPNWVNVLNGDAAGATFVATAVSDSNYGANVGRATNRVMRVWNKKIPFDPDVLYRIVIRVRQTTNPSSGNKEIYTGIAEYAGEDDAPNSYLSVHWAVAYAKTIAAGSTWTTYVGYVKGRNTAGQINDATNPASPSTVHSSTRFIAPAFAVNFDNSSGGGVVDIDQITIESIANPDNWINTAQISDNAITTLADVAGADISDSTGVGISGTAVSVTFAATGKPVEITVYAPTVYMQADGFAPSVLRYTILKNGVSVGSGGFGDVMQLPTGQTQSRSFSYTFRDTPSAGTVTYGLFLQTVDTLTLNHPDAITITRPSIKIIEVKK